MNFHKHPKSEWKIISRKFLSKKKKINNNKGTFQTFQQKRTCFRKKSAPSGIRINTSKLSREGRGGLNRRDVNRNGVKRRDIDVTEHHYTDVTGAEISGACFINNPLPPSGVDGCRERAARSTRVSL